jgi:hypothetical protein
MENNSMENNFLDNEVVHIDRERMERALASPTYVLPHGLTKEEIMEHLMGVAKESKKN